MNDSLSALVDPYARALQDYLDGAGEAALQRAYELGRQAIDGHLGVLDMAAIHHTALVRVLSPSRTPENGAQITQQAGAFFAESLSPFEMTQRGFQEAILKLRELNETLERSQEQLRALSAHQQSVREQERTRIAREIHDELGQQLTGLKMDVAAFQKGLGEDHLLLKKTKAMSQLIDTTIRTVRRIATDLRPSILDDLGLPAAIEWQLQEFQTRVGIQCQLITNIDEIALDPDRLTAIFRVFQETLTNVARHANATQVEVNLEKNTDTLRLQIRDNGRGISEQEIFGTRSLGLLGMRERVYLLSGSLEIQGKPGQGTTVLVQIPLIKFQP